MSKADRDAILASVTAVVIVMVVVTTIWVIGSWLEAAAYTRVTGKSVTAWDAMWLDLRVQESPN